MQKYKFLVYSDNDSSIFYICDKCTRVHKQIVTEVHYNNGVVQSYIIPYSNNIKVMTSNYLSSEGSCPSYFPDGDQEVITRDGLILGFCDSCEHFYKCPLHIN